jgi:monoamine oxidase
MYTTHGGILRENYDEDTSWDSLLDAMKKLESDLPFGEFLLEYFSGTGFNELRKSAIRFAEGFDLVDVQTASTKALASEWLAEESGQFRIPGGYHALIREMEKEFISSGGRILFKHAVESVDWSSKLVLLGLNNKQTFTVEKLIITVPVYMLNHSAAGFEKINFKPFPSEQMKSFAQIGYGTVIKLVMIWKTSFWKKLIPDAQFLFADCFIPTWWTQYPLDQPVLTGWLGGPAAENISQEPDEFFLNQGLESLSTAFSIPVLNLKSQLAGFRVFNWKKETWSRGAYSYATVKSHQAKILSMRSLGHKIYFTGEAFYEGPHPGTVESALVSGKETARLLRAGL